MNIGGIIMFESSHAYSGFSVDDLAVAKTFYSDTLGLNVTEQHGMLNITLAGGGVILVYPKGPAHEPASYTILNFPVGDIDAAVDELIDKGISIEHYENSYQDEKGIARGKAAGQGPDIAWFKDPAGNILSVLSE
jgi:catechol 2,3-dioxygenase-like lactoylglutathione lyase family enzyme